MTTRIQQSGTNATNRGSAILIVVGTLALIAVFAAIYISIGQSDQRVARSIKNRNEIVANSGAIADHILGVIGDDRLDFTTQPLIGANPVAVREVTDAPYTDWVMRSESVNVFDRFNPSGRHSSVDIVGIPTPDSDYRVASDPWLASTTPVYLGDPGQPMSGSDDRPFASLLTGNNPTYIANAYSSGFLDKRDWLQISNLAPDGRFVNLFNLRQNSAQSNGFSDTTIGGFGSEPGTGTTTHGAQDVRRMSEYLSLWKPQQDSPDTRIQAFDPSVDGLWLPGRTDPDPNHGLVDLQNIPAVWTMYQRFSFLPLNQPFITVNRNGQFSTWADPDFAPYQWADADGDGMADSRWFELSSAREPQSASTTPRTDVERLYDSGRSRLFVAARVVDLSSMANVNTALDQVARPNPELGGPAGATPGDVDLRRLLSLSDPGQDYSVLPLAGLSLSNIHKPVLTSNNELFDVDYKWYRSFIDKSTSAPLLRIEPSSNSMSVGRFAYTALKQSIEKGSTLDSRYYAWPPELRKLNNDNSPTPPQPTDFDDQFNPPTGDFDIASSYRLSQFHEDPITTPGLPMSGRQRSDWYNNIGRIDPFQDRQVESIQSFASAGKLYDQNDLFELLAFHGLNDPDTVSRLERATMGRMPSVYGQNQRAYSPLLSNRPLSLDRTRHGFSDLETYVIAGPSQPREVVGKIAKESMAFFAVTPRKRLTTVSGGSTLRPGSVIDPSVSTALADAEAALPLSSLLGNPAALFSVYSQALVGELHVSKIAPLAVEDIFIQDLTLARAEETATLFYGHRGPELGLRIAAHAATNMTDLYDQDSEPTITTLLVDDSLRDEFENLSVFPTDETQMDPDDAMYRDFPGASGASLLDLGASNLPGDQPGTVHLTDQHRRAVNIYGVEPMPILTETVSFYVYHDASENAGGDLDYDTYRPKFVAGRPTFIPIPGSQTSITIGSGTNPITNPDCLMQGVAFQLHNPWETAVSLGGQDLADRAPLTRQRDISDPDLIDTAANYQFDYYIEWNGYFFKLAEYAQYYPPSSSSFDLRNLDNNISGASNPYDDFGPDDGVATGNGGFLDPTIYPDFVARNATLQPGETRVFYAIADPFFDPTTDPAQPELRIDRKWRDALSAYGELPSEFTNAAAFDMIPSRDRDGLIDGTDRRGWTGPAKEWVQNQFNTSDSRPPVMVHPMNPQTGEYGNEDFYDYLNTPLDHSSPAQFGGVQFDQIDGAANRQSNGEVRLWRKITTPAEETTDPAFVNRDKENLLHNDLLVDRMTLITGVAQEISLTDDILLKTASFEEDYPSDPGELAIGVRNDNTGYSLVRWASTSRRDTEGTALPGIGQVREWMLSSRSSPALSLVGASDGAEDFGGDGTLDNDDFVLIAGDLNNVVEPIGQVVNGDVDAHTDYETHRSLGDLFNHNAVLVTASLDPYEKNDLETHAPGNGTNGSRIKYARDDNLWPHPDGITLHADADTDPLNHRPELMTDSRSFNGAPRLADLLLVWGIGPTHTPTQAGSLSTNDAGYFPEEWMTLPEAMAIALGYVSPTASDLSADNIWAETFNAGDRLFDNGHLVIDNFVSYYNVTTTEDPPEFDTIEDIRRGNGIPLALGVLDHARAIAPLSESTDPQELLSSPTFGQININTAPIEVLRLLPGLSPNLTGFYPDNSNAIQDDEWWAVGEPLNLPDLTDHVTTPDVASTLIGYRDRLPVDTRFASRDPISPFIAEGNPLRYSTPAALSDMHANNLISEQTAQELSLTEDHRDRSTLSGINGLRQTPGFGSIGEVLMATIDPDAQGAGIGGAVVGIGLLRPQLDIQQYGKDTLNLDGDSDDIVALDPQLFAGDTNGGTVDDYAERIAMANGILNTISVRSDYFAVWFVIHAYQESDVTNLQPEDPLVPTIAKRYVMVVDRTSVKDPGDTPKVVFVREVPM